MLSGSDIESLRHRGISEQEALEQLRRFEAGFPFIRAARPATAGDGILRMTPEQVRDYGAKYDKMREGKRMIKFVPASGAATRMFRSIFEVLQDFNGQDTEFPAYLKKKGKREVLEVLENISSFAFAGELESLLLAAGHDPASNSSWLSILKMLTGENGMNYGKLPKGLLLFHLYPEGPRTAAEEHLVEAALYAASGGNKAFVHFTVSPEHREIFIELLSRKKAGYEKKSGLSFQTEFSIQHPSTDTLAADMNNRPFREPDGSLLFRPGGHGALLENLNGIPAEVIFIKNIDNVVPDRLKNITVAYKKALGGLMLEMQERIFGYLVSLNSDVPPSEEDARGLRSFIEKELYYRLPDHFDQLERQEKFIAMKKILDRPLRVCGMVRNEGEPGGGPFWVWDREKGMQLQIVESSQFNPDDPAQKKIFEGSTHFNPVDLVCSTIDHTGKPFDLMKFRDHDTGFISGKSKDGRDLKALELPGLWNGSMAFWNTVFVEVPIDTFRPVKTINDLLRPEHREQAG